MATVPLKALWLQDKPVAFSEGSTLDTDLQTLVIVSIEVRLPLGVGEKLSVRAELKNGRTYEGQATTKMPRDMGGRNQPTLHIYELFAKVPLEPVS